MVSGWEKRGGKNKIPGGEGLAQAEAGLEEGKFEVSRRARRLAGI